jgi:hypothetical protein
MFFVGQRLEKVCRGRSCRWVAQKAGLEVEQGKYCYLRPHNILMHTSLLLIEIYSCIVLLGATKGN